MRRVKSITILMVATSIAGCASGPSGPVTATNNPSLYSVHQPVIERQDFVLDLDASGDQLSIDERARLAAWFETIELRYGDRLFIDVPRNHSSAGARGGVASVAAEYGMLIQPGGAPVVAGTIAPGTIRVIASRAIASVPSCPNWGEDQVLSTVRTSTNFGCATNSNLAAQVADPNDLVLGQEGSLRGSAQTANRAIRVYRDRPPTGAPGTLPATSTRTGGN